MAIQNTSTNTNFQRTFVSLDDLPTGTGSSRFADEAKGILLGIEPRPDDWYEINVNGQTVKHPSTWNACFEDGTIVGFPTYWDENEKRVKLTTRFEAGVSVRQIIEQRIPIHMWRKKNARGYTEFHIVLLSEEQRQQAQPQMQQPQPQAQPQQYYQQQPQAQPQVQQAQYYQQGQPMTVLNPTNIPF